MSENLEVFAHTPHATAAENVDGRDDYHVVNMTQDRVPVYL